VLSLSYAAVTRTGEPVIREIGQMRGKTIAIPAGWSIIRVIREAFPDIRILEAESSEDAIRAVVEHTAYATVDASAILHYTAASYFAKGIMFHENIRLGDNPLPGDLHFLIQSDMPTLAELLNTALAHIGETAIQELRQKWFDGLELSSAHKKHTVPYEVLVDEGKRARSLGVLSSNTVNGRPMLIYITRLQQDNGAGDFFAVVTPEKHLLAPSMQRVRLSIAVTAGCLLLLLPLTWLFAAPIVHPIKRLALENDKIKHRRYDKVALHDTAIKEIYELSTSIVDMALIIKQHEESLKTLLESFIQLIAQAIDDKSPFTAEHCARVPKLALMLVDAASRSSRKPFDQFSLHGEDEYREFRIAAWLHDCGKITTPEYIVNKATKLETLYNRIHEIRMRFEVLWRDAEIDHLKNVVSQPEEKAALNEALAEKYRQLQEDFAFIASLNIGSESMTDDQHRRLQELASIPWQRHFDDRLGISVIEAARYPEEKKPLPVTENLIADKPEHVIAHSHDMAYDQKYGITMDIPDHLYDRGELHNLSVNRGTLTREDRFKIQEHMISTIKMLESLPFPEELAKVPRYASTHHETLRGTGYPRKLCSDDLSIPERIIAVADIFEALTAADRPYKNAKKLSEAVDILYAMVEAGDIDREVFELFLTSGVYLSYSKRYLNPEQIDAVPISRYVKN
jgi:HD-GYP domain-containing protein (c-di-GMP phosphodiesterase class II)